MKLIKSILGTLALTAFIGTTAFAQDNQDVNVSDELESERGEAEYSLEKDVDENEVETEATYSSEVDTDGKEAETEFKHESERDKDAPSSGITKEDLEKQAKQDVYGEEATKSQDSKLIGSNQDQQKTEIAADNLPEDVNKSIDESEYAAWTITRVYEISPEQNQSNNQEQMTSESQKMESETAQTEDYGYTEERQDNAEQTAQNQEQDAVLYEIYFLNPDGNEIESQRYDEQGVAR